MPTKLGRSPHCAQNLAVEVQPCPLRPETGSRGPEVPTARGSWRRVGKAEVDVEVEAEAVEETEEDEDEEEEKEEEKDKEEEQPEQL